MTPRVWHVSLRKRRRRKNESRTYLDDPGRDVVREHRACRRLRRCQVRQEGFRSGETRHPERISARGRRDDVGCQHLRIDCKYNVLAVKETFKNGAGETLDSFTALYAPDLQAALARRYDEGTSSESVNGYETIKPLAE
ncbi:hypothetical protein [Mesorhizobium sp. M0243]|uniref:hypothetical protein n=1 Tax=Mesorhizobium sp. M0243 TaxID=2956925 RepID=UPI00333ADEFE